MRNSCSLNTRSNHLWLTNLSLASNILGGSSKHRMPFHIADPRCIYIYWLCFLPLWNWSTCRWLQICCWRWTSFHNPYYMQNFFLKVIYEFFYATRNIISTILRNPSSHHLIRSVRWNNILITCYCWTNNITVSCLMYDMFRVAILTIEERILSGKALVEWFKINLKTFLERCNHNPTLSLTGEIDYVSKKCVDGKKKQAFQYIISSQDRS